MGDKVKAAIGLAIIVFAPYLAGAVLGAGATATAVYLTTAAITLAGASLTGSAYTSEAVDSFGTDSYSGIKLQTQKSNISPVPIIFGENRIGSNIIFQRTNEVVSGATNKDFWSIQVIGEGEINDYLELYANQDVMVDKGSDVHTLKYTHVKVYNDSGAEGMALNDVSFAKDQAGNTDTFGNLLTVLNESNLTLSSNNTVNNRNDLFDLDSNTKWRLGSTSNEWIKIDLGFISTVSAVGFKPIGDITYGTWTVDYSAKLQYSDDGSSWTDTGDSISGHMDELTGTYPSVTLLNSHGYEHRYWRLYFNDLYDYDSTWGFADIGQLTINSSVSVMENIPANIAFMAIHQVYETTDNDHVQLDNITAKIQGKKIRTITNATTISTALSYSNNPADIILELLTDALSIDDANIDIASFYQAQTDCSDNSWTCNIALIQQANVQSIINDILSTCRGQIVHSEGVWKLKIDTKSQTLAQALTDDDIIINSLNISMKGNRDIANKIVVKYVNPSDEWLSAQVVKEDIELQALDSQTIEKTLDIKGITNATHAVKLAEITLNSMRYTEDASGNRIKQTPLVLSFATTVKNAHLEVGDVISIDHDVLDRVRKFVILSAETDQSGLIQITTREYAETHYKDSSGTYLI